jgi:dolichol-phosphate mannosyltransferase
MLLAMCSLPVLAYAVYRWLQGEVVPGWTSLMVVVLLVGGVQLLVLGVMGEYLGRLYMEAKRRPLYVVRDIATSRSTSSGQPAKAAERSSDRQLVVATPPAANPGLSIA